MRRHPSAGRLIALAVALAGCSSKQTAGPVAPAPPPPPQILAVAPAARSVFVPYDAEIWVEFGTPLDPTSVNPENVYLKIDTVRQPISLTWDAATRRIHVIPAAQLLLLTTYSVELSPNVTTAAGVPLGAAYVWQFTTTSVRHPSSPIPADRSMDSPFVTMSWGGNETTPGSLSYELYAATDSALVATRAIPPLYAGTRTLYMPKTTWPRQSPNFWSVTVVNAAVGERSNGAVWRFDTPPANAAIDSVLVSDNVWGYKKPGSFIYNACSNTEILTGRGYIGGIGWALLNLPQTTKVAGMVMELTATPDYQDSLPGQAGVWLTLANVTCGGALSANTDDVNGHMAIGVPVGPRTLRFDSDTLTIHAEAAIRRRTYYGYMYRSQSLIHWDAPGNEPGYDPLFKIYYYSGLGVPASGVSGPPAAPALTRPAAAGRASRGNRAGRVFPLDRSRVESVNSR